MAERVNTQPHRRYVFTLNNPGRESVDSDANDDQAPEDYGFVLDNDDIPDIVTYLIYQEEVGEEGTYHWQGYLVLKRACRLTQVKNAFPILARAHFECARGNDEQCIAYCSKEETRVGGPYEFGTRPRGQGSRTDLYGFKEDIKKGSTDLALLESHTGAFMRYYRMIPVIRSLVLKPRDTMPKVYVLWGPTNVGKSHWVREKSPQAYWKARSNGANNWFDGYQPGQDLVLDEFYGWITWDLLLRICDKYPLQLESKGGSVPIHAPRIFITSNEHPRSWYKNDRIQVSFDTFGRRVHSWMEWTGFKQYTKTKTCPPLVRPPPKDIVVIQ